MPQQTADHFVWLTASCVAFLTAFAIFFFFWSFCVAAATSSSSATMGKLRTRLRLRWLLEHTNEHTKPHGTEDVELLHLRLTIFDDGQLLTSKQRCMRHGLLHTPTLDMLADMQGCTSRHCSDHRVSPHATGIQGLLMTHFAFLKAAATLSHALLAELATVLQPDTTDACSVLATSAPLVAVTDACKQNNEVFSKPGCECGSEVATRGSCNCYNLCQHYYRTCTYLGRHSIIGAASHCLCPLTIYVSAKPGSNSSAPRRSTTTTLIIIDSTSAGLTQLLPQQRR